MSFFKLKTYNSCLNFLFFFLFVAFSAALEAKTATAKEKKSHFTLRFKAAHGPYEVISKPFYAFKKEVEEKTHGRVAVEVLIPKSLAESNFDHVKKTHEELAAGKIQMSQLYTTYMTQYERDFFALDFPFMMDSHQHAFSVVDGSVGQDLLASLEKNSPLVGLGFTYCGGYRMMASQNTSIHKLEDFQGLRLNIESPVSKSVFTELGASVLPRVSKENLMKFVQSKKTDGYETVYPRYFHWGEFKTANIVNALNLTTQFTVLVLNKKFFNSLSKNDQAIVKSAAEKAIHYERQLAIATESEVLDNATKHNLTIVKMSEFEKSRLVQKINSVDWAKKFGVSEDILKKIKSLSPQKLTAN